MDTGIVNDRANCRNILDTARQQHLLAIQRALASGITSREVVVDLVGFDGAANALVALARHPA